MAPSPSAADATVADALQLLDGPFASRANQVSQDRYALWLGSGISLGRVEGLPKLIVRVLHFLQQHVTVGDANCPFRIALDHVFVVGSLSSADRTGIDVEKPVSEWPNVDSIVGRLIGNYARFLDTARLPERLAMVRPDDRSIGPLSPKPTVRALDADAITLLMKRGEQLVEAGDFAAARTLFQRAAEADEAAAAIALGATYDPAVLAGMRVVGIDADVGKARFWYQKAVSLGSSDAKRRLELLANR